MYTLVVNPKLRWNIRASISVGLARSWVGQKLGWLEPYMYGVYTVILAGKSPNERCVYIYGSGQP